MTLRNPKDIAIDELLSAIEDASDGEPSWLDHGPYVRILSAADELRKIAHKNNLPPPAGMEEGT